MRSLLLPHDTSSSSKTTYTAPISTSEPTDSKDSDDSTISTAPDAKGEVDHPNGPLPPETEMN